MSHVLKVFLKVIHKRIYVKYEEKSGDMQFGFENSLGTRETLYYIQLFVQKYYDQKKHIFICFIQPKNI